LDDVQAMTAQNVNMRNMRLGIREWFGRTPGKIMLDFEIQHISQRLPEMFGYELLQVGQLSSADMLASSLILRRSIIDIDTTMCATSYPTMRGQADALPIASDSIDVVILPHVLEFESRPHEALREAQRVLVPEGNLLICGFNPWSMLGVWRSVLNRSGTMPWCGEFFGLSRVRDWLALLSFDVVAVDNFFFRPPFASDRLMERLSNLEHIGPKAGGMLAGLYLISARKRVSTLTPIKPRWTTQRRLASVGLANPSVRASASKQRRSRPELTLVHAGDTSGRSDS
jgi:SAM-dependent methyltransferase